MLIGRFILLLDPSLFTIEGAAMLNSLGVLQFHPMVRSLLFCNTEYSKEVNMKALEVIQNYFTKTSQFWCQLYQLVWLFLNDGQSFSMYSQCWCSWNTLTLVCKDWWCRCVFSRTVMAWTTLVCKDRWLMCVFSTLVVTWMVPTLQESCNICLLL